MQRFRHQIPHDIFISYPHVEEDVDRWVSEFHKLLEKELKSRTGREIDIWRDSRMNPGIVFESAMLEAARTSAVFIPILSEAWVASEACQAELAAFLKSSGEHLRVGDHSRLLPVEKLPVEKLPAPLDKLLSARFYDVQDGRVVRFGLPTTYRGSSDFERAVQKISDSIALMLRHLEDRHLSSRAEVDKIVAHAREHVDPSIRDRCSTMKILSMTHGIDAVGIYTHVNMLEKLPSRRRLSPQELRKLAQNREDFDRFGLGEIKEERVDGLEAARKYPRLLILGKPGAGKTTFLRRLAYLCNLGTFRHELVPAYVPLREYSERNRDFNIEEILSDQWSLKDASELRAVLKTGRGLILLDGLDEVGAKYYKRIIDQINTFTRSFPRSPVVMTCRIAAREYAFEQFAEVEIADFDRDQIRQFAEKWFAVRQQAEKSSTFISKLIATPPMLELASSPLLLTLLCLIFEERSDFEGDRAELYREGLDVLLRKWDATRNIERDQPYRDLSVSRKQDLLGQIAYVRFERGEYFFDQASLEAEIRDYFVNQSSKPIRANPEATLRAIEAQHGLLVARAHRVYSFSHLTFQEYLTAKRVFENPNPDKWDNLLAKCGEARWREVMLLVASMVSPADDLLTRMLACLNDLACHSEPIQKHLAWVAEKSRAVNLPLAPEFIRAVYWSVGFAVNRPGPQRHETSLARYRERDEAKLLQFELAHSVNPLETKMLEAALDAERDHDLSFAADFDAATCRRDVTERQLARMVNEQFVWTSKSLWVTELRELLLVQPTELHDDVYDGPDTLALEEYEQRSTVLLECLRSARVTRNCHERLLASVLMAPERI